jgi:tRNA threonylcarbamoyladenosine biosynthesis protein TsaE
MEAVGKRLAGVLRPGMMVHLQGELGIGKTTLVRGVLHGLGHAGAVKSPTYTLVEPYVLSGSVIYHFDLYRIVEPEDLELIGIRDYVDGRAICLVEWPERGSDFLAVPDLLVTIRQQDHARELEVSARTAAGEDALAELK